VLASLIPFRTAPVLKEQFAHHEEFHRSGNVSGDDLERTIAKLNRIERDLEAFIDSTEEDFLSVGNNLRQFYSRAANLSRRANSVVNLMMGDEIIATVEGLEGLLDQLNVYTRILDGEAATTEKGLREVLTMLGQVVEPVESFKKIVKTMNILGLSTKVENAQHLADDMSFFLLADDLRSLAENIDAQATSLLRQLKGLEEEVSDALTKVSELRQRQRAQGVKIINNTRRGMNAMAERHQSSSSNARRIAELTRDISLRVGEVVTSMQFHDLTRQQIEHVAVALRDITRRLERESKGLSASEANSDLHLALSSVCRVQQAQVGSARDELVGAVQRIKTNLHDIASSTVGIARETSDLSGATDEAGSTFLVEMESGMRQVAETLEENARRNRESTNTIDSLANSVTRMEDFLHEIEKIGAEMKILALNAGIKAARVNEGGAGLSVISEAIQKLSSSAMLQSDIVARFLTRVTTAARNLGAQDEENREERRRQVEEFLRELESLLNSLHLLNRDVIGNLDGMDSEGRTLAADIEQTVSGITVHEFTAQILAKVLQDIESVAVHWQGKEFSSYAPAERKKVMNDIVQRYSMSRERKIHQSITGQHDIHSSDEDLFGPRRRRDDDLGDNVELF